MSQFWYDDETTRQLVDIILKATLPNSRIALISCPTLYKDLKKACSQNEGTQLKPFCLICDLIKYLLVTLYEYDKRFSCYGADFVPYDYKSPLDIPRDKSSYYDLVIADPPFLSDECLTKTAVTIKYLTKEKILICTGAIMEDIARRLLDVRKNNFKPHHRNNLANEFCCYSNFNVDQLL